MKKSAGFNRNKARIIFCVVLVVVLGFLSLLSHFLSNISSSKHNNKEISQSSNISIVAAGDIACGFESSDTRECQQNATTKLIKKINPQAVLALGDLQYEDSSLSGFQKFYDSSWGIFKSITYPVVGNHEYEIDSARGYFEYFGNKSHQDTNGYYSFNIGNWHMIALNSNCWVAGCSVSSSQYKWLEKDLSQHTNKCTLAFWHHPRFSIGQRGDSLEMNDIWNLMVQKHVDIVLSGHDHVYERFSKMDDKGLKNDNGVREFVVGTGGRNLYDFTSKNQNLEESQNSEFGILKLTLKENSYNWEFVGVNSYKDSGVDICH